MQKKTFRDIATEAVERRIFVIRGHRVILDEDLAELYGVPTKRLNEQVRRNLKRFPQDFAFRLSKEEAIEWLRSRSHFATLKAGDKRMRSQNATASSEGQILRSQNATSRGHGGRRYLPYAFTEHGALMAANVLSSEKAVTMSIYVIRAFVRLREVFLDNHIFEDRLSEIEKVLLDHDVVLEDVYEKICLLLLAPKKTDAIGFQVITTRPGKIG